MTTILITGSTDGIGLATAEHLAGLGHRLVLHGRNPTKLDAAARAVDARRPGSVAAAVTADLSRLEAVDALAEAARVDDLAVVVNNAGVFRTDDPITDDGLDVRFVVNTIAPYRLTRLLFDALPSDGRVVNLSSAAQAPVDLDALAGRRRLDAGEAYAQSKLALTMWSNHLAAEQGPNGPVVVAVNPGSLLATNMVRDGYGIDGNDIGIGVDILTRAAVGEEFAGATGRYFDNDARRFSDPHPDALDPAKNAALVAELDNLIPPVVGP
ncbi:MAG: SDR family NAD(P)-dependent oxidoreductase [Actinomycetota bacterium]